MPIPPEYQTLFDWYNGVVSELAETNGEFATFQKYWNHWTPAQKPLMKTLITNRITAAIAELQLIKAEIDSVPLS